MTISCRFVEVSQEKNPPRVCTQHMICPALISTLALGRGDELDLISLAL